MGTETRAPCMKRYSKTPINPYHETRRTYFPRIVQCFRLRRNLIFFPLKPRCKSNFLIRRYSVEMSFRSRKTGTRRIGRCDTYSRSVTLYIFLTQRRVKASSRHRAHNAKASLRPAAREGASARKRFALRCYWCRGN